MPPLHTQRHMNETRRCHLIVVAAARRDAPLRITEVRRYLSGTRFGLQASCDDGYDYAIKGIPARCCQRQARRLYGRELFLEQTVGILGHYLGAPIPDVTAVDLPAELIQAGTWLRCLSPGVCHAVRWIDGAHETRDTGDVIQANSSGLNRQRLATLAILVGWISDQPGDTQYLLKQSTENRMYSVDHGMLAHSIPVWADIRKSNILWQGRGIRPHHAMARALQLRPYQPIHEIPEFRVAAQRLVQITSEQIAYALATPPDSWGVTIRQRVWLMQYLQNRREKMVRLCLDGR